MKCLDVGGEALGIRGEPDGGQLVRLQPDLEEGRGGQGRVLAAGRAPAARHWTDDPAGGLYIMAADVRSTGKGRTEVALYRPTMGYKD